MAPSADPEGRRIDTDRAGPLRKGLTLTERRAARREALLAAGLELFGTQGYAGTGVEEICRRSSVSTRNFYEEFANKEALLSAVYDDIAIRAHDVLMTVSGPARPQLSFEEVRAPLAALIHTLLDDLRVGRVVFIESRGVSPAFEQRRQAAHQLFASYLAGRAVVYGGDSVDPPNTEVFALGMVGAVNENLTDWVLRDDRRPLEHVIDDLAAFFLVQQRPFVADERRTE